MRMVGQAEMVKHSGATYRQIDNWTTKGHLLSPDAARGSGSARHWSLVERDIARLMVRLTKTAGFTLDAAAYLARMLATTGSEEISLGQGMSLTVMPPEDGYAASRGVGGA